MRGLIHVHAYMAMMTLTRQHRDQPAARHEDIDPAYAEGGFDTLRAVAGFARRVRCAWTRLPVRYAPPGDGPAGMMLGWLRARLVGIGVRPERLRTSEVRGSQARAS